MVSQRQRSKLKVESTIHAMRLALEYMQKVNIKPEEVRRRRCAAHQPNIAPPTSFAHSHRGSCRT